MQSHESTFGSVEINSFDKDLSLLCKVDLGFFIRFFVRNNLENWEGNRNIKKNI